MQLKTGNICSLLCLDLRVLRVAHRYLPMEYIGMGWVKAALAHNPCHTTHIRRHKINVRWPKQWNNKHLHIIYNARHIRVHVHVRTSASSSFRFVHEVCTMKRNTKIDSNERRCVVQKKHNFGRKVCFGFVVPDLMCDKTKKLKISTKNGGIAVAAAQFHTQISNDAIYLMI